MRATCRCAVGVILAVVEAIARRGRPIFIYDGGGGGGAVCGGTREPRIVPSIPPRQTRRCAAARAEKN